MQEEEARRLIEQLCTDLNTAHNEVLKLQNVPPSDWPRYDWPEWSAPANTLRWAETLLQKPLSKTSLLLVAHQEGGV